jgi:hypothetical protein
MARSSPPRPRSTATRRRSPDSAAKRSSTAPEELLGLPVAAWLTQQELAEAYGYTDRHLRTLEAKGLPGNGDRLSLRYPEPHAQIWISEWRAADKRHERLTELPFAVALALHRKARAIEDAEVELRCATDPLFAKYIAAGLADDWERADAALIELWRRDGVPAGGEDRMREMQAVAGGVQGMQALARRLRGEPGEADPPPRSAQEMGESNLRCTRTEICLQMGITPRVLLAWEAAGARRISLGELLREAVAEQEKSRAKSKAKLAAERR